MITLNVKGILLSPTRKPYEIEGRSGLSTKAKVLADGEVYDVKIEDESVYESVKSVVQEQGDVTIGIKSARSGVTLVMTSFKPAKSGG